MGASFGRSLLGALLLVAGLLVNVQHMSACRQTPQAFSFLGQVPGKNTTVILEGNSTDCWVGNGTLLEVLTDRAGACMTVQGCKAFTLQPLRTQGFYSSCLLSSAPDRVIPSLNTTCFGVFSKVDGRVQGWGRPNTSPVNIPDDASGNVANIYANAWNAYAVLNTGYTVVAWGDNDYNQTQVPEFASLVISVAAGRTHALALLEDGTVKAWGENNDGQTDVPPLPRVVRIAAGSIYSLALLENGTVVGWGYFFHKTTTIPAAAQANVVEIAAGLYHALALLSNGTVVAWGNSPEAMVVPPAAQANVKAIAAGWAYSLALLNNGTVVVWGDRFSPLALPSAVLSNVKAIAAGFRHALALLENGTVVAWGENNFGQCDIPSDVPAVGIAAGEEVSLLLLGSGTVVGYGFRGADPRQVPVAVQSSSVSTISCSAIKGVRGDFYCQALLTNSTVVSWAAAVAEPNTLWNISGVISIANGELGHALAVFANGTASRTINGFLDQISSGDDVKAASVAITSVYMWALLANGTLVGDPIYAREERLVYTEPDSGIAAISAWDFNYLVLLNNGTVLASLGGSIAMDVAVPRAAKANVVSISAGQLYHLALLGNGTLVAWQVNTDTQINLPRNFLSDIVRASAGDNHFLAMKSDGQLLAYGLNTNYKQLTVPATVANAQLQSFVAADDVSFAILTSISSPPPPGTPFPVPPPPQPPSPPSPPFSVPPVVNQASPPPSTLPTPPSPPSLTQGSPASKAPIIGAAVGASAGAIILLAGVIWLLVWCRRRKQRAPDQQLALINSPVGRDSATGWVEIQLGSGRQDKTEKSDKPSTPSTTATSGSGSKPPGNSNLTSPNFQPSMLSKWDSRTIYQAEVLNSLKLSWNDIKLGKVIGAGGFGTVYRGHWRGDQVAVKVLNVGRLGGAYRAALQQEALAMVDLRHPRIVPVYGLVDEGEHCALVMKYFRGGTLAAAIANPEYLGLKKTALLKIALQVAGGMQYLHDKDMLHGDLKTSNLLVDEAKGVAITDFGLSCVDKQAVASGALTVQISPPEVLLDPSAPRTKAGDAYAFGIVLFEIMAGRQAFQGMNRNMVRTAVCAGHRPSLVDVDMHELVAETIVECWAQDASARPSFTEVVARLEAAVCDVEEHEHDMGVEAVHAASGATTTMPWAFAGT